MSLNFAVGIIGAMLAIPMLILGAILFRMGHWPKRRGSERHCSKCDYRLAGITSDRCPECGTPIDGNPVVRGTRERRGGLTFTGITFLLLGLISLLPMADALYQKVDWYRFKPTGWVIDDIEAGRNPARAWRLIERREESGSLSKPQQERVGAIALKEQASRGISPFLPRVLELLARMHASNHLDEKQSQQFARQSLVLSLETPPTVVLGNDALLSVKVQGRSPGNWFGRATNKFITIDGNSSDRKYGGSIGVSGIGRSGASQYRLRVTDIGTHLLEVVQHVEIFDQFPDEHGSIQPIFQEDRKLVGTFEVIEAAPTRNEPIPDLKGELIYPVVPVTTLPIPQP